MTVYKGYMKIVKQNKALILLYLAIFFGVTMMFQSVAGSTMPTSYQASSVKVGIVDKDGGPLARSLETYLEHFHDVSLIADDTAVLQEKLFYRDIEYIVHIPANFFDTCISGNEKLSVTKVPGSYTAFYVDQQINSFLNNVRTYNAAGFSEEEAAQAAKSPSTVQVDLLDTSGTAGAVPNFVYYYRYVPYLFLSILCYVMGNILSAFRKGDLPKRMQASAVSHSPSKYGRPAGHRHDRWRFMGDYNDCITPYLWPLIDIQCRIHLLSAELIGNASCSIKHFLPGRYRDDQQQHVIRYCQRHISRNVLSLRRFCTTGIYEHQCKNCLPVSSCLLVRKNK